LRTLAGDPLSRFTRTTTAQAGATLNKPLGDWNLTATADYSHSESDSTIDRRADFSVLQAQVDAGTLLASGALPALIRPTADRARTNTDTVSSLATLVGRPFRLPGGEASLTLKAGFDWSGLSSEDTRNPGVTTDLKRGDASAGFSLDLPVTSRREGFGAAVGDISLNLNADFNHLSDFGTLKGYGAGLTWSPTEKLTLQASYIASEAAPGLSDLGAPTIITPAVSVYDFTRGETVLVNLISGGNPLLEKERQRDWKFGLNWQLPFLKNSRFVAEYFRNRSYDTTNGFPLLTPAIEAAFPGRVVRDASGRLVSIDQRPVTFAEEQSNRLRYGFNIGGSFGKPDPNAGRGPMAGMGRGGGGGGGPRGGGGGGRSGGGFGGPGGGGDGKGRWNLALYHTIRFDESVLIAPGGPRLDLLDGDAISGGGVARNALELEGGAFYRGFGLRFNGTYTGGTHVNGTGLAGSSQLNFAPIATFDLRLFADLGRMDSVTKAVPFLKGSRLSFKVDNLFDAQQRVTDANGLVPLRYQPGYLDPRGRVFEIEFRKQF
jgi:outer membrane receptor protein involved in Fe transport